MMEKVVFKSLYGELEGDFYKGQNKKCIILCHGQASNKDKEKNKLTSEKLYDSGFSVLAFNFGGSGNSYDTEIDIDKQVEDLKSAVNFVKEKGYDNIGLIGDSLGGLIVLKTYPFIKEDVKTLCLWAPVSKARLRQKFFEDYEGSKKQLSEKGIYIREKDGKQFRFTMKHLENKEKINQKKLLSQIDCPVLFIHGTKDDTVSLSDSKEAVEILKDAKLEILGGAPHNFKGYEKEISELSLNWFKKYS